MSFRNVGGSKYAHNINNLRASSNRIARRQGYLAMNRYSNDGMDSGAPLVFNAPATQAVATNLTGDTLVLPVPKKKKKVSKVTRKTLLRDVQQLKSKVNKQELKFVGLHYQAGAFNAYDSIAPSRTAVTNCCNFFAHPISSNSIFHPTLAKGTGSDNRIGDKVYFVSARMRLAFRLHNNMFADTNQMPRHETYTGAIAGTATTAPWTGTLNQPLVINDIKTQTDGYAIPIRFVSLAIREDYLMACVGQTNNRNKLHLSDIFTYLNDWSGAGNNSLAENQTFLYSRKVKNAAAGKVRIKEDTIEFVSSSTRTNGVVVFDKTLPIRQEYSFETNKTNGWVHGLLVHVPNIRELQMYTKGAYFIDWTKFVPTETVPLISWEGGACYYYYDS